MGTGFFLGLPGFLPDVFPATVFPFTELVVLFFDDATNVCLLFPIEDSIQKKSGNCKPVVFSDSLTVNHLVQPYKGIPNPSYLVNQPLLNRLFSYQHRSQIPGQHLCI